MCSQGDIMENFGYVSYISQSKIGKTFLEYLKRGELASTVCIECKQQFFPPRANCNQCLSSDVSWVLIPGKGKIISFSEVNVPPKGFEKYAPYMVVVVKLVSGGKLLGWLHEKAEIVKVGMEVNVSPQLIEENRIVYKIALI